MHEIKMSVSQLIIVGFEKLKHQNVHQHLLHTLRGGEGVTKKRAFCTLELNVDIIGWPLSEVGGQLNSLLFIINPERMFAILHCNYCRMIVGSM